MLQTCNILFILMSLKIILIVFFILFISSNQKEFLRRNHASSHPMYLQLHESQQYIQKTHRIKQHYSAPAFTSNNLPNIYIDFYNDNSITFDWTKSKSITPVKDQGHSKSCYAFAAVSFLQSFLIIKKNSQKNTNEQTFFQKYNNQFTSLSFALSTQYLIECDSKHQNACGIRKAGGFSDESLSFVLQNGIPFQHQFHSKLKNTNIEKKQNYCKEVNKIYFSSLDLNVKKIINANNLTIKQQLKKNPLIVAICSDNQFTGYSPQIRNKPEKFHTIGCNSECRLNHQVLLIGYTTFEENQYWIIQNSHGIEWGYKGYGYISMNTEKDCGIHIQPRTLQKNNDRYRFKYGLNKLIN